MATTLLNKDPAMIERMESDLTEKVRAALANVPDIELNVNGVFSLDHLETLLESDLCNGIGVGVAYLSTEPHAATAQGQGNVDRGNAAKSLDFSYIIVLAVPTEAACGQRHNATQLLTLLRLNILGSAVGGDRVQRTWDFVRERPEISDSTKTLLYYSQVWRVNIPSIGNLT